MFLIYSTFTGLVNRKTHWCTAPFLPPIFEVEYSLTKLINFYMCLVLSINQSLQILQNKKIIKKHHRIAYIDLLTHDDTLKPFVVTRELLEDILNLSISSAIEILNFLVAIGLLKRNYCTWHNGERDIPNSITLQLVPPLEVETTSLTSPDVILLKSSTTFRAKFIGIDSDKSRASVLVRDVSGIHEGKKFYINRYLLDYTQENASFMDELYEGDQIEFLAIPDLYKNKAGKEAWFLHNAQEFKVI